jgi:hypothetical protein
MSQPDDKSFWWALHLRKARGEALSEQEQQVYDAEIARQDREAPGLNHDLAALKAMREQIRFFAQENVQLRGRLTELDRQIRAVEAALSEETQKVLGVGQ